MSKKTQDALRKYYSTFDYGTGVKAYKRGGKMGFTTNKFPWGGPTGDTWIPEIDNTTIDESFNPDGSHGTDYYIRQYWNEHPEELFKTRGVNDSVIADWKSGQGAGTNWSGLVSTVGSIIGEGMESFNTMDAKEKDLSRRIGSYGQGAYDGITDNLGLIAASNNIGELKGIQREDIRDKSIGQDAFSAVTKGLNAGLSTGNIYVGLGVAAGDIGRSILERIKARNITDRLNEQTIRQNAQLNHQLRNASEVVDNRNFLRAMQGYYNNPFEYALGGEMRSHGSDWNSGLTFINAGGRHEENPYEGVPSGVDDEGVPNLVEEGEVIWNDEYVFSDRLKVPKELANKYKLGGDKTFAEAIEEVTRESRTRPNDPISNETNRAIVNEFMDAQEALREEEQAKAARQLQTAYDEDFMNQLAAFGPQGGIPMQEGLQLPPQGVNEEGMPIEGAPAGFALGGNKFDGGGWEDYATKSTDSNGNTIYTTSDGRVFYSESGVQKYIELNKERLISNLSNFEASPIPARITANRTGVQLPKGIKVVYGKGRNGNRGPVHHYETSDGRNMGQNLEKAIAVQRKINGEDSRVTTPIPAEPSATPARSLQVYNTEDGLSPNYTPLQDWNYPWESIQPTAVQSSVKTNTAGYARGNRGNTKYDRTKLDPIVEGYLKTFYREGSPVYKEKKAEALKAQNARWDAAKRQEANSLAAQEAFQQEQNAHIQRLRAANQYKQSRGYGLLTPMSSEDRAVFDDIISGTRDASGNLASTSQAEPTPAGAMRRYATSSFDRALSAGYVPTATSALPDEAATQETPQSSVTVKEEDIRYKNNQTKKAANDYLKSKGVSNYSNLTDSQKAEYIRVASGTQGTRRTGSAGTGSTSTGLRSDIDYNRKLSTKESKDWEARAEYQDFLKYMRSNPNSPEAKQWMGFIQDEIRKFGSSYTLKNFDDWSRLAEDGKVGPVHQATLLAAQNYAKRQNAPQLEGPVQAPQSSNRVTPSSPTETTESLNAAIEATRGTQQSPVTTTTTQTTTPKFNYRPTWQRMAPVYGAGAAALYGMINRPDYFNADSIIDAARAAGVPVNIPVQTIGDYRTRNPYDERYLVNMANQNMAAGQRSLYNTSGGNRAMDMLGAMSLAHNNQVNLGEIMRQAYLANRQDDAQVSEFNRGTNIQNMNAINQRNLAQAQLNSQRQSTALSGLARGYGMRQGIKDNWDAATMQSLNSMLASLGAIGKENEEYNILTSMAEQGYFPYYYGDKSILQHVPYTVSKNGGKLNKKKRRF